MRKGVIDRFEGDIAIIEVDGTMLKVPARSLPKGAREGDAVAIEGQVISLDPAATKRLQHKVQKLMDEVWDDA